MILTLYLFPIGRRGASWFDSSFGAKSSVLDAAIVLFGRREITYAFVIGGGGWLAGSNPLYRRRIGKM